MSEEDLDYLFGWVEPTAEQHKACVALRTAMRAAAAAVLAQAPDNDDRREAIRALRMAQHSAVSAVIAPQVGGGRAAWRH